MECIELLRRLDDAPPPAELLTFDGRGYPTALQWLEAFKAWCDARRAWEQQHPGMMLQKTVLGACPWSDELFLGPVDPETHEAVYRPDGSVASIHRR